MMRFLLLFLVFISLSLSLNAQTLQALEDDTTTICDTDLLGGANADTMYICTPSLNGTTTIDSLCADYLPNPNYFGYDSVCLTTCVAGVCVDTVIHITINPVGESIYQSTPEDASFFVCEAIISGGSNVVIAGCSPPLYGTDAYNPACVIYTPPLNYVGMDSFCIVSCIDTLCDTSTLVMTMTPVTENVSVSVPGNNIVTICYSELLTIVDSVTSFSLSCGPTMSNGTTVLNDTCITYIPDTLTYAGTGITGTDQICISVCNSAGVCDVTNVNINITGFDVINNSNAQFLAESLAGAGVTISNAVLSNCNPAASGYYTNPPSLLGINDGIILSSGTATDAAGPSAGILSTSFNTTGEPDLQALLAQLGEFYNVNDACVLEFDIDVLGDSLTFNYVMGSEEYNNFVCGTVNDIFGFFVTGQNPVGPNYVSENVALLPGTTTPVSINTVNNGSPGSSGAATCVLTNTAYFNGIVPGISYGGNTVALEANILTEPCTPYHFKLAIGDGGDWVFDSGVFLEAGSFRSIPVTIASSSVLGPGFNSAVEDCVDGVFTFVLDEPFNVNYGVNLQIGGTATNGVDYTLIQDSITFYAGDSIIDIVIQPITDNIPEGTETIKLYLINDCTGEPFDSAELTIIDLIPYNLNVTPSGVPTRICPGDTAILHATIAGDDDDLAIYNWTPNDGTILDVDSGFTRVIPLVTTDYYVEYTLGTCTKMDTITVEVANFTVDYDTTLISCPGANDGGFAALPSGFIDTVTYSWSPSASTDSFVNNLGPDTVYITSIDGSGLSCGTIVDTLFLEEPASLTFSFDVTNISCKDAGDGQVLVSDLADTTVFQLDVTYEGVLLPSQNATSDLSGEFLLTNLPPGVYDSIVITNTLSGCSSSFNFIITEPDTLMVEITTPGVVLCAGGTIDSLLAVAQGGTMPYSYLWNTIQTTPLITGVSVGSYWVQVTDTNLCQATDTFIVAQPSPLGFSLLSDTTLCFNGLGGIAYIDTVGGGVPAYSYSWDATAGGQTTDTAFNLAAGTYTLTVTDFNGCSEQNSITIFDAVQIAFSETHTDITCVGGADGTIDLTVSGGAGGYTFAWTGPNAFTASTEDVSALEGGTYTVVITDANNCTETTTVTIDEPAALQVTFNVSDVNCFGGNDGSLTAVVQSGGTAPFTFQWDANANNQTGPTANGLSANTYQVTATDANGCMTSFSSTVGEPASPLSIVLTGTDVTCAGLNDGTISVVASGGTAGYSYLWNDPLAQTTSTASNLASNTYQVTVTDANGCIETDTLFIDGPDPILVTPTTDSANCWGQASGEITLMASGGTGIGYAYSIDGGLTFQNSPIFTDLPAGVYDELVVQDLGSNVECLSQLFTTTVYEQAYFSFVVAPADTTLQLEESVNLSLEVTSPNYTNASIAEVNWTPTNGLNCNDCVDPIVLTYDHYTEYEAQVSYYGDDSVLCDAVSSAIIQVENNLELFIPNAFTPGSFDEVNNVFEVFGEGIEYVTMQIYNRWGEKIFESSNQKVSWDGTFKGEMQNPGVYSFYVNVEYLDGKIIDRKGSVTLLR